ncbi:MAG: LamG domain-containing protein, partial [Erysipelotrichaceae bacterium]|nr:LamG domain-containing protein [Erysipelotrichaceae bacterium]
MKRLLVCLFILGCLVGCNSKSAVNVALNQPDVEDELWTYTSVDDLEVVALPGLGSDYTISFWIKPEENRPGTTLFHLGDDSDYICVTTSGYNDGVYSGLTIERRVGVKDHWNCADGGVTVKTNRYNLITFTVSNGVYSLYLNGEKVISSDMKGNGFEPDPACTDLYLGHSPIGYPGVKGYIAYAVFCSPAMSADEQLALYNSKVANVLLDTIEFKEAEDMRNDLWLVDYQLDGLDVNWKVSDESLMNFQGLIKRPIEKDAQLTLTARMDTADSHA